MEVCNALSDSNEEKKKKQNEKQKELNPKNEVGEESEQTC